MNGGLWRYQSLKNRKLWQHSAHKNTGNSQEWETERAGEIGKVSPGGTSLLHFCVQEAGWRHSSASEKTGRLLHLLLFFSLLLSLGLHAFLFQVGFIPSCGAGHVSGCQREPCDVNPTSSSTPLFPLTTTQPPPPPPPPAQRGGAEVSKLSGNYVASRIGKCLFIYLPILMIYHVASFGDDLLSVT